MSNRPLIVVLVISVAINLAVVMTFGYYWWGERGFRGEVGPGERHGGADWRTSRLRHRLDLTEEQLETMDGMRKEMRSKTRALRSELLSKRRELTKLLRSSEPDRTEADSLIREIGALQTELEAQVFENLWDIRDILTPEQRAEFSMLFERRLEPEGPLPHMEGRFERRMRERPRSERGGVDSQ